MKVSTTCGKTECNRKAAGIWNLYVINGQVMTDCCILFSWQYWRKYNSKNQFLQGMPLQCTNTGYRKL